MISKLIFRRMFFVAALLFVMLVGCSGLTLEEQLEAQFYATQYAKDPSAIPPAKYQTLAATALNLYLPPTAVSTSTPDPHWTPTMSFYDFSGTQVAQQQAINLTQGAQQLQIERGRAAAGIEPYGDRSSGIHQRGDRAHALAGDGVHRLVDHSRS